MKCSSCSSENQVASQYCNHCGSKLDKTSHAFSSEERQRIYDEERIRDTARRDLRRSRVLKSIGVTALVCLSAIALHRATRRSPTEELRREAVIAVKAIKDVNGVLEASHSLLGKSESKTKEECSAFFATLEDAQKRVDDLQNDSFRIPAQQQISVGRSYLVDHTPCGSGNIAR